MVRFVLPALLLAPPLLAQTTVQCDEPRGSRYDLVSGEVQAQEDAVTGARPLIIIPADPDSGLLRYAWGPAQWAADAGAERELNYAVIVSRTPDKITAFSVADDRVGLVQMLSLFPRKKLVLMSQHRHLVIGPGVPHSSTFYSRCTFTDTGGS